MKEEIVYICDFCNKRHTDVNIIKNCEKSHTKQINIKYVYRIEETYPAEIIIFFDDGNRISYMREET